jgi:HSP20 family molecular chaperone IbpA
VTDEDAITASYDKGILSISVPVSEPKPAEKRVEVTSKN